MNDLIKIIFAALVGALAKELISWLVGYFKSKQIGSKTKLAFVKLLRSGVGGALVDVLLTLLYARQISALVNDPAPLTRVVVFSIAINTGFALLFAAKFIQDLKRIIDPPGKHQELIAKQVVLDIFSRAKEVEKAKE